MDGTDDGEFDPAIAALLACLWEAAQEPAGRPWSLAKLGKRADMAMSTLLRALARLEEAGLAASVDDGARRCAVLSAEGAALCGELFAGGPPPETA